MLINSELFVACPSFIGDRLERPANDELALAGGTETLTPRSTHVFFVIVLFFKHSILLVSIILQLHR